LWRCCPSENEFLRGCDAFCDEDGTVGGSGDGLLVTAAVAADKLEAAVATTDVSSKELELEEEEKD
jgi:hypothetical protein